MLKTLLCEHERDQTDDSFMVGNDLVQLQNLSKNVFQYRNYFYFYLSFLLMSFVYAVLLLFKITFKFCSMPASIFVQHWHRHNGAS